MSRGHAVQSIVIYHNVFRISYFPLAFIVENYELIQKWKFVHIILNSCTYVS